MARLESGTDRRHELRLPLNCHVQLIRKRSLGPIRAQTCDVSSRGFYCLAPERITASEILSCDLILPAIRSRRRSRQMILHCNVEVLRIEERLHGFGVACRIRDYSVEELN